MCVSVPPSLSSLVLNLFLTCEKVIQRLKKGGRSENDSLYPQRRQISSDGDDDDDGKT